MISLRELATTAVTTPSLDAEPALTILTDALLMSEIDPTTRRRLRQCRSLDLQRKVTLFWARRLTRDTPGSMQEAGSWLVRIKHRSEIETSRGRTYLVVRYEVLDGALAGRQFDGLVSRGPDFFDPRADAFFAQVLDGETVRLTVTPVQTKRGMTFHRHEWGYDGERAQVA